ncbi:MAG: F0F1 ATP synthase subunit delta [Candidatus Puniceispirillaceae bacterium]
MSSVTTGLAARYAGALYDLASEAKAVDAVLGDLETLGSLVLEHDDLARLISSPVLSRAEQMSAMTAILEKAGAHELTVKFIGAVAENGRLFALTRISQNFSELVAKKRGQISAEVVSAVALDKERQKLVEKSVAKMAGSDKLSLSMRVDPSLIGGLVVRIGSRMIDTSIKTKLNRLEAAMKGVA